MKSLSYNDAIIVYVTTNELSFRVCTHAYLCVSEYDINKVIMFDINKVRRNNCGKNIILTRQTS